MSGRFSLCLALVGCLVAGIAAAASGPILWLEAEKFDDLGGWTNDSQFIAQMGSPYLLAIGLDGPVADAKTVQEIPAAGQYRLWVRTRDWDPEHSPGRFQVLLSGKPTGPVFGQTKAQGWVWEDGGTHAIPAGRLEIRLHDLTGHYGRCDAIVLSAERSFRPPAEKAQLAALREKHGGVSPQVKTVGRYDTVVIGGGLAGTFAAVASARSGARTALVQNRPVLGGNGSTEILVAPEGDTTREPLDPGEGGIIEEVRGPTDGYSARMLHLVQAEKKLELFLNTHAIGVEMASGAGRRAIAAVVAQNVQTGQRLRIAGTTFIDCTGDGEIGVWAGAEHRHGREPRSMYHEQRAPEKPDTHTMGGTLRYASQLQAGRNSFQAPAWARHFPDCDSFNRDRHPQIHFGGWQWVIEYGGQRNTYDDAEEIRDELVRVIWGMWDHVKNHCPKLEKEAENYKLAWVSHVVGKRESRRLIGDYVLTESDIASTKLFPDRVSYCGWGIDIHPPGGFYDTEPPATFSHKLKFSVPFRCLYSKDVANLMMAGRNISVSHVALGATRVMITCGLQGQAAGTAAGLCRLRETTPRGIYQNYITDLQQQLLKDGCYLIDLPNQDPHDLALKAKATASSTSPPVALPPMPSPFLHSLGCNRAVMFRVENDRIGRIAVELESKNRKPTPITLGLRAAMKLGDFDSTTDLATASAVVPPRRKAWVSFTLNASVKPGYYYVWLPKTPGVSWALFEVAPESTARAYQGGKIWNSAGESYKFQLEGEPPASSQAVADPSASLPPDMFAPAHVVNGFARAIRGTPNSWRPDPKQPLPQWIELDFGRPVDFNSVHVSFQSKLMRAEAFHLEAGDGQAWTKLAGRDDNSDRRCVLAVPPTKASRLRLVLTKARPDVGVCEIRVYDEPR